MCLTLAAAAAAVTPPRDAGDAGGAVHLGNCTGPSSTTWAYSASTKRFAVSTAHGPGRGCLATSAVSTGQLRVSVAYADARKRGVK